MEASKRQEILQQIDDLRRMKMNELRVRYREVVGEETRSSNRPFLFRRIAWRLQARAEGGLSERIRERAREIANDADLRLRAPEGFFENPSPTKSVADRKSRIDRRLPVPGTLLTRSFENRRIVVTVLKDGFEYQSRRYRSLSAIAREVTGTRWNGLLFFGLTERRHG
jgi:hypothetical protein